MQFSIQLDVLGRWLSSQCRDNGARGLARVRKHYYSSCATEKNDVIFSKRQTSIQSEVGLGPLNPAMGSGGAL